MLFKSFSIILFCKFICFIKNTNNFNIGLMCFNIEFLLLKNFLPVFNTLNTIMYTYNCFFSRVASWRIFLASFSFPSAISSLALFFITSILASYFRTVLSNLLMWLSKLLVIFSPLIWSFIFFSSALCFAKAFCLSCCSWGLGLL